MLEAGMTMPQLDLCDSEGKRLDLADVLQTENVLIYFMRTAGCPVCNSHVKDLSRRSDELTARNVRLIVAVPGGPEVAAAWKRKCGVSCTVITGENGTPHEGIGMTTRIFGSMQQSGSVLIGMDGIVLHTHKATIPAMSYDRKGLAAALSGLDPASVKAPASPQLQEA